MNKMRSLHHVDHLHAGTVFRGDVNGVCRTTRFGYKLHVLDIRAGFIDNDDPVAASRLHGPIDGSHHSPPLSFADLRQRASTSETTNVSLVSRNPDFSSMLGVILSHNGFVASQAEVREPARALVMERLLGQ